MFYQIIKSLLILTIFGLPMGCGSHFMFTYSDRSTENYLEDQRQTNPWISDTAVVELDTYDTGNSRLSETINGKVKKVIDWKTILLESGEIVKYIGVEIPQNNSKYFEEALDFNKLLVDNKAIKLQFDIQGRDSNGNLLAYVFVEGIFVNAAIIKHGFSGFVPHTKNNQYHDLFTVLEAEAVRLKKGVWSSGE
ncbi:MAG: thermonuclease family protein [Candidatus Anammoxibacter sp.]